MSFQLQNKGSTSPALPRACMNYLFTSASSATTGDKQSPATPMIGLTGAI